MQRIKECRPGVGSRLELGGGSIGERSIILYTFHFNTAEEK